MQHIKNMIALMNDASFTSNYHINMSKINKRYDIFYLLQYLNHKKFLQDYPFFDKENSIKSIYSEEEGKPLVIFFQGFFSTHVEKYWNDNNNLKQINSLNKSELNYAFSGFVEKYPDINYVLVKDNFQCWYMINFDKYLLELLKIIDKIKPSKVITAGASAGGFAAILFAHYIKADRAFAYSPQILTFYHYQNKYRQAINTQFKLSANAIADLSLVQRCSQGFLSKIDISLAKDNRVDMEHLQMLDLDHYDDIIINYHEGDNHNIFALCDKNAEFERLYKACC